MTIQTETAPNRRQYGKAKHLIERDKVEERVNRPVQHTKALAVQRDFALLLRRADVAELADALDSKSSVREDVWVRPPPSAPRICVHC